MNSIFTMFTTTIGSAAVIAAISALFFSSKKRSELHRKNKRAHSFLLAFVFGILSIYASVSAVSVDGLLCNCRNLPPLYAGMVGGPIAGIGAADYCLGQLLPDAGTAAVRPGDGVRYVLPQRVHRSAEKDVELFLRVREPMGRVRYTVSANGRVLTTAQRLRATPGEMEKLVLKAGELARAGEEIVVSAEEVV